MTRAQCITDSRPFTAGQPAPLNLTYISETALPKGTMIRLSLESRRVPFGFFASDKAHIVLENAKINQDKSSSETDLIFKLGAAVSEGEPITFHIAEVTPPKFSQRRYPILIYVDPKGKGLFKDIEPDAFYIDVKGGPLAQISVRTHAIVVARNERFDIFVRYEDQFGNVTALAPEDTRIQISHHNPRKDSLSWQLFVAENGVTPIYQLYFSEIGNYAYELTIVGKGVTFKSDPIRCIPTVPFHYYAGLLSGDPEKPSAKSSAESIFRYFRDELCYHFYGLAPFESQLSSSLEDVEPIIFENWKQVEAAVAAHNEDGRFSSLLSFYWLGEPETEGMRLIVYGKDHKPLLSQSDGKYNTLKKLYKHHTKGDLLSIPVLSGTKPFSCHFEDWNPDFERVIEIYNSFGSMEGASWDNSRAPQTKSKDFKDDKGSVITALNRGCRFGFVAGGHISRGACLSIESKVAHQSPGLTIILAAEETRQSFFEALIARRVYATTGARIIIDFKIADEPMGSELSVTAKPGFKYIRPITGYVLAPSPIAEIAIIRNGVPFKTFDPKSDSFEIGVDDEEFYSPLLLHAEGSDQSFLYYYIRVKLADGHMAWSSPIWIDYPTDKEKSDSKGNRPKKGKVL